MKLDDTLPIRTVEEIEKDFSDLMSSHIAATLIHDGLEQLWDEANSIAAAMMLTEVSHPYIALLARMQRAFEARAQSKGFAT
jgi:hypothetical protein